MKPVPHILNGTAWRGLRIGLLGGSFNPAHEGHLHISLFALKKLRLHAVWWLVSPQNPLKSGKDMASFAKRFAGAQAITKNHPRILVSDMENQLGTRFTADTLRKLQARYPSTKFIWMMGADNLLQMPRWQRWPHIFTHTNVAVFRRPPYFASVTHGIAATRFKRMRLDPRNAARLGAGKKKFWILFNNPLHSASATRIREMKA